MAASKAYVFHRGITWLKFYARIQYSIHFAGVRPHRSPKSSATQARRRRIAFNRTKDQHTTQTHRTSIIIHAQKYPHFSVETFGRWGKEALDFLRGSADAVAEQNPQVACLGHWGKVALLNAWHTRLSVALQKGNAKCLLQAGRVRGHADFVGDSDWNDDVDDLLRDAAATAGFGGFEA